MKEDAIGWSTAAFSIRLERKIFITNKLMDGLDGREKHLFLEIVRIGIFPNEAERITDLVECNGMDAHKIESVQKDEKLQCVPSF